MEYADHHFAPATTTVTGIDKDKDILRTRMAGIKYPPHIADKLYILDASIETLLKDRYKTINDFHALKNSVDT
ncbi:MAG: hypothetical protein Q9226_006125 [Calogaya cf. arnoldii]